MDLHRLAEERSIAYHTVIAERLQERPEVLEMARRRVATWLENRSEAPFYAQKWAEILAGDVSSIAAFLVDRSEFAIELRQSTPFCRYLSHRNSVNRATASLEARRGGFHGAVDGTSRRHASRRRPHGERGRTVEHEFMQIREIEPGKIAFIAHPSGQSEASFPLAKSAEREVVFENLEHDFPQRVIYKLDGDGVLRASIEGLQKGQLKTIEFPMKKVDCETQR